MSDMIRLDYYKSTRYMHVFRTDDPEVFAPVIYIRKKSFEGDKPPTFITLIHFPSQETTDERHPSRKH